jgi:HAD superfamily hydrolase (TIGR01509 family)
MPQPKAVLFDMDGTLIDTVDLHARAWVDGLQHFGVDTTFEDMRVQIGKGGDQLLQGLLPPGRVEDEGDKIQSFRAELFKRSYLSQARAFPGVRDLFEQIRSRGQRIVLASSGKADEVKAYQEIAGIADLIDDATSSDDAERSKPFPDIFQAAFNKLSLRSPSEAMVVGDTPYDAEAARQAGLATVGVLCGGFQMEALRAAGCVAVYRDPQHLAEAYDTSPLALGLFAAG